MMMSKTEAAYIILKESKKPLHVKEIIHIALKRRLIKTKGKTPDATMRTDMYLETRRKKSRGERPRFKQVGPSVWTLVGNN